MWVSCNKCQIRRFISCCKKFLIIFFFICFDTLSHGFGWYSHEVINYNAVFTFSEGDLFVFFKKHIKYFSKHAADPDKIKYKDKNEGFKHFLNIDAYEDSLLKNGWITYENMLEKYGEKTVRKYGTLPWSILATQKKLTKAFLKKNTKEILRLSIHLAHYIADAMTPLHTTKNYDGQETDQRGIHSLWETRLPKLFINTYDFNVGRAQYVKKIYKVIWNTILESHNASKFILKTEKELDNSVKSGKFAYCKNGNNIYRMHSKKYATKFHEMLNGQVEQQIRKAIKMIGDFIYTSYIDAGSPKLL